MLQQQFYIWKICLKTKDLRSSASLTSLRKKLRGNEITVCIWGMEIISENKKLLSLPEKRHAMSDQPKFKIRLR